MYHRFVSFNVLVLEEGVLLLAGLVLEVVGVEDGLEDSRTELAERMGEVGTVRGQDLVE